MKLALNANYELQTDPTKIVWTDMFKNSAKKQEIFKLDYSRFVESCYRPLLSKILFFKRFNSAYISATKIIPYGHHF